MGCYDSKKRKSKKSLPGPRRKSSNKKAGRSSLKSKLQGMKRNLDGMA